MEKAIRRVLIANRGEIAARVIQTCRRLGIQSVAAYSDADANALATRLADDSVHIGPPEASQSYLDIARIVDACRRSGADAVHPGYGFLSENEGFARALADANVTFIGPSPDVIRAMGDKIAARRLMEKNGVPIVPGYDGDDQSEETLLAHARRIGFPVMLKASAGGGGRGMRRVDKESDFVEMLQSARRESKNAFGDDRLLLEKFVSGPRHIEVQVFGDEHGNVRHLYERECSVQRRHQKVIEESPSPALDDALRAQITDAAVKAAQAVNYTGAGTVEFIFSDTERTFYFLEMNTRLQVEHPVTELITNMDLVAEQIRVARGLPLSFADATPPARGHAIEARLYAEDPARGFSPTAGKIHGLRWPSIPGIRIDTGVESGSEISIYYDPMIAKVIAYADTRAQSIALLDRALAETVLFGPETNLDFLREILNNARFQAGNYTTNFIAEELPNWRGPRVGPDERELARTAAGLLFYQGGKRYGDEEFANRETEGVALSGGDLAPWYESPGFRLWE